jgi:iron complex outermembrane receptor protein
MCQQPYRAYIPLFSLSLTSFTGLVLAADSFVANNENITQHNSTNSEIIVITGSRQTSDLLTFVDFC